MTADLAVPEGATWAELHEPLRRVLADPAAGVVVATSGSSGAPKRVRVSGAALRASGRATARALGGHGHWILALPVHHVAGLQVLARSALAGTEPVALPPGMPFTPSAFAAAAEVLGEEAGTLDDQARDRRPAPCSPLRLVSLVPTQLHRLLEDPAGRTALASLDAVLLGAAAADPALLDRARALTRVVTTYGMSETSGGCVYDGVPLPGVQIRIDPTDGRIWLGGPVLADGYVDAPALTAERFITDEEGQRWFVTDDRGTLDQITGRLILHGRVDDVIVTGGHKVEPQDVEEALRTLPGVQDALVVGLPDPLWGQLVAALVVVDPEQGRHPTRPVGGRGAALREQLRPALPPHALPRRVATVDRIPLLGPGKPDRARARQLLIDSGRIDLPHLS